MFTTLYHPAQQKKVWKFWPSKSIGDHKHIHPHSIHEEAFVKDIVTSLKLECNRKMISHSNK